MYISTPESTQEKTEEDLGIMQSPQPGGSFAEGRGFKTYGFDIRTDPINIKWASNYGKSLP